jgi:hypothetical protein
VIDIDQMGHITLANESDWTNGWTDNDVDVDICPVHSHCPCHLSSQVRSKPQKEKNNTH